MKNFSKQFVITLLTIVAIGLLLAIIFYGFIPSNKVIPAKVTAYATPENVASEIKNDVTEKEFKTKNEVYEVTDSDLELYQSKQSYNPGKSNPFEEYKEEPEQTTTTKTETGASTSNASSGQVVDKNTTDNYYTAANVSNGGK